ncbi:uncharacterized protein LOC130799650 isoform X2 [Amaranthus tricolor]|uniref:uncharacterized protein LOC130799650 isoform X2 n=1 Tax=Amaranthus tricolor TaxID=29722 RepID=UPI00258895A6|nr:uncharacterized protein LOC130799650 isoform X2 [Amaranthus tricolor]
MTANKASKKFTKMAKSLGGSSSFKRKITSTPSVSTTPSISNYNYEPNYPEGYDQELHNYAEEVEREIQIDEEKEQEEEPTTPIEIHRSRQSSTRSHEEQLKQQQQRQARGKRVNFQTIGAGTGSLTNIWQRSMESQKKLMQQAATGPQVEVDNGTFPAQVEEF